MHWFCVILFINILWVSFGLKLISNIDDVIVYNTTGAHAAEVRGGMFIHALDAVRGGKSTKIFYSSKSTITLLKFYLSTSKSTSLKIYSSKSKE